MRALRTQARVCLFIFINADFYFPAVGSEVTIVKTGRRRCESLKRIRSSKRDLKTNEGEGSSFEMDEVYKPEVVFEIDGKSSQSQAFVKAAVAAMLAKYQRSGYIYVTAGVFINVPWLIVLFVVRHNITYNPNAGKN